MSTRALISIVAVALPLLGACDCGSSHETPDSALVDGGGPPDAPGPDAPGTDGGGGDGGPRDGGPDVDGGVRELRVIGSFGTTSGPVAAGRFRLVDHGFQRGARSCAGSLCVTGAFVR